MITEQNGDYSGLILLDFIIYQPVQSERRPPMTW